MAAGQSTGCARGPAPPAATADTSHLQPTPPGSGLKKKGKSADLAAILNIVYILKAQVIFAHSFFKTGGKILQ